jgi:hypothetical protein
VCLQLLEQVVSVGQGFSHVVRVNEPLGGASRLQQLLHHL